METATASHLTFLIPVALIGFGMVRRFQRFTSAQTLDERGRRRLIVRPVILSVLALVILALPHPLTGYLAALIGALLGAGLALWSVTHTRFEYGPDGNATRYIPNVWIGTAVFALFAVRLLGRLWPLLSGQANFDAYQNGAPDMSHFVGSSPLTTGLFLLFAAYQVVYALLVLKKSRA